VGEDGGWKGRAGQGLNSGAEESWLHKLMRRLPKTLGDKGENTWSNHCGEVVMGQKALLKIVQLGEYPLSGGCMGSSGGGIEGGRT